MIGTGCSAIQVVPAIAPRAASVTVYQRSPGWTIPKLDYAYSARAQRAFERFPLLRRLDRASIYAFHDFFAYAMTQRRWLLNLLRGAGLLQLRLSVEDPTLRRKLTPRDEIGCKRIMLTDDWYPALNRPDVDLVTERIERVAEGGVRTVDGRERPADVLVLATGFDSHAFVAPMEIAGARRPHAGRGLGERAAGLPRHHRPRLPQHVPALRARTRTAAPAP